MEYLISSVKQSLYLIINFDIEVYTIVLRSLYISALSCFFSSLIGIPLGMLIAHNKFKAKKIILVLLNTLFAMPTVVIGIFLYVFLSNSGLFGNFNLLFTKTAIIIGQIFLILPFIMGLTVHYLSYIDKKIYLTAISLGATKFKAFLLILYETKFLILSIIMAGFGRAIGEVGISMILGGNIKGFTRTITTAIALENLKGDFHTALALGMILLLACFIINFIVSLFKVFEI